MNKLFIKIQSYASLLPFLFIWTYPSDLLTLDAGGTRIPFLFFITVFSVAILLLNKIKLNIKQGYLISLLLWIIFSFVISTFLGFLFYDLEFKPVQLNLALYSTFLILLYLYCKGEIKPIIVAIFFGVFISCLIGSYRYIFGTVGDDSELLLGYWGIRYTASTRNADVLYPIILFALTISFLSKSIPKFKVPLFAVLLFSVILIVLSQSRSSWVCAAFVFLYFYQSCKRSYLKALPLIFISLVALAFVVIEFNLITLDHLLFIFQSIFELKSSNVSNSNEARINIIWGSIQSILYNPLGYGLGNFSKVVNSLIDINSGRTYQHAENLFLTICVEGGFFAMVFMGTYLFYAFKWVTNEGVKLMLIALTVYSFFNYEIYSIFYLMILLLPLKEVNNFNDT